MESVHKLAMTFGGYLTVCYCFAVAVHGTNGALFAAVTNALIGIVAGVILYGKKKPSEPQDPQGQGQ